MGQKCDLLLIDPVTEYSQHFKRFDNISLGYLASYARHVGYSTKLVSLFDFNSPERLKNLIQEVQPSLIGISSLSFNINYVLALAKIIKRFTQCPIVLGGPHVSFHSIEFLAKNPHVDFVIKSEGELKLILLLEYLTKGKGTLDSIPCLVYRKDGEIHEVPGLLLVKNMDLLPFPQRSNSSALTPFTCSRGCKHACKNCLFHKTCGPGVRWRSADNVVQEFKNIKSKGILKRVYFLDCTMNDEPEKFIEVCKLLVREGLLFPRNSMIYFRIGENTNFEMLKWAKRVGISSILVGVESGSRKLRKLVGKDFSDKVIFEDLQHILKMGLVPNVSFMIGIPGEAWSTIMETFHLMTRLFKMGCLESVFGFKPFFGTEFFENSSAYDYTISESCFDYWTDDFMVLRTKALSEAQLASVTGTMRIIFNYILKNGNGNAVKRSALRLIPQQLFDAIFFTGIGFHMLIKKVLHMRKSRITLSSKTYVSQWISWRSFMAKN